MRVDFCLPIKDEEIILETNLNRILDFLRLQDFSFVWKLVGLVNGSSDGSLKILKDFKQRFPEEVDYLEIIPAGKGGALKKYWHLSPADVLAFMDVDLVVSLHDLKSLVLPLVNNEQDLVVGSRFLLSSKVERSWARQLVSQSYRLFSQLILQHRFSDLQCGFKAIRRESYKLLEPYLFDDYWFFDTELIIFSRYFNLRFLEIPVDWREGISLQRPTEVKFFKDSYLFIKNTLSLRKRCRQIKKYSDNASAKLD